MGIGFRDSLGMRTKNTGANAQKAALARRFSTGFSEGFAVAYFGIGTMRR
jgi:hypothetical protein